DRLMSHMRSACSARNFEHIMHLYPFLLEARSLTQRDVLQIAAAMHVVVRNAHPLSDPIRRVYPFVQRLVEDIKAGSLPPHPFAHLHLLGIFKSLGEYDAGYAFWSWLLRQDDSYVSPPLYGAAIELLVHGHKSTLAELERLYMAALQRFPGTFAAYHLSPNAIIANRDQLIAISDLRSYMLLLQGILTARIKHGKWKNAYLDLDTALRLHPTTIPTRFFELFMTNRPLHEEYTVFLVACRAGIVFKPSHLTVLIKKLRASMHLSPQLNDRMILLRAITNAMYAYLEAGGTLEEMHINGFIGAFGSLLPGKKPGEEFVGLEAEYRNALVSMAHHFVLQLILAGVPPHSYLFTALINLAASARVPDMLYATLEDAQLGKVDFGEVERRVILRSAGLIQDLALLEQFWSQIVTLSTEKGQPISPDDWFSFAKACKLGNFEPYFRQQILSLEHTITSNVRIRLDYIWKEKVVPKQESPVKLTGSTRFASLIKELKAQVDNIITVIMSGQPMDLQKTPFYMTIDPDQKPLGTLEDMRIVYDEFTVDPHQPPQEIEESGEAAVPSTSTGIPLGELRFLNWVSIVEIMNQADLPD
ncbi:hypothetical protein DM02DRAFT_499229, partial [Periconia macrospinosa]